MIETKTRKAGQLILLLAFAAVAGAWLWLGTSSDAGKRMYREGLLPSGQPLEATVQNSLKLSGDQAACVNCHRRSGFGISEGGLTARSVTGPVLFSAFNAPNPKMYPSAAKSTGMRPAYTEETLARAIREGIDADGQPLHAAMPRFILDKAAMKSLIGYLKTLSAAPSPGVTNDTIHFATIVTEGVSAEKRQAMLDVVEGFVRDKNAGTRHETLRAKRAGWDMEREYGAYRNWQVHVWELTGEPETWRSQLVALYRQQPVFALLSGITAGTWQPVHDFCENLEIPCLFPNVDAPPIEETGYYSFYFSKGVGLEAEALAHFFDNNPSEIGTRAIIQVFRNNDISGMAAVETFGKTLKNRSARIVNVGIDPGQPLTADFWSTLAIRETPSVLVLWLNEPDLSALSAISGAGYPTSRLYLSSTLATGLLSSVPQGLKEKIRFLHSFELPEQMDQRLLRINAWLKARKINLSDQRIQANTYFALTQAGNALMHLVDNFSRDYFVERIEHGVDNSVATSVYSRLSLGPGQRFAAKACAVVEPVAGQQGQWMTIAQ
jgi:hypothetical protein